MNFRHLRASREPLVPLSGCNSQVCEHEGEDISHGRMIIYACACLSLSAHSDAKVVLPTQGYIASRHASCSIMLADCLHQVTEKDPVGWMKLAIGV